VTPCHRGLTLLEVLIATALLAILAVASVPVIARAMTLLNADSIPGTIQVADLAAVADAFIAKPADFGLGEQPLHEIDVAQIDWPEDSSIESGPAITIRALRCADGPECDHLWLVFECERLAVCRWVFVPPAKPGEGDSP
jgi:prepilin-type N-terminal cleavage/methylation domain-containing protein